ncbi:MAG: cytochrome ubiquinol oxidase subunit I [Caenispirillum bisanense]|nr:cytochrome ubiquinol oxidase subunit I [Caenispirillum bisanense]MCA1973055.1 cytochrome ubiquinol oxidase subunit I [Caenispirillum sp.]
MDFDPLLLSRIQFGFVVSFHILFPAFTIGLSAYIALLEILHLVTGNDVWGRLSRFWIKIFGVSFGMGVVSGIVMSYQFGMNWSRFSEKTGNVLGPLLTYEVLTAFFLEATFLGILLLGRRKVSQGMFTIAAITVALGTLASSFWILAANSWMHTPAGYEILPDGSFAVTDWWAAIFNPSFPYRLTHMVTAAMLTTGFCVMAVSAWKLRRGEAVVESRTMMSMTLWLLLILAPAQVVIGDLHGLNTLEHQPSKLAAIEGHFETNRDGEAMGLSLLGWPDMEAGEMRWNLEIPYAGSILLTHTLTGEVAGLDQVAREDWPTVPYVYFGFRLMVGIGFLMVFMALAGNLLRLRHGGPWGAGWYLALAQWCLPIGFVAILAGWVVTEHGRQPWVVYGLMRTADAVTPSLSGGDVVFSFALFIAAYAVIFPAGIWFIRKLIKKGPPTELEPAGHGPTIGMKQPASQGARTADAPETGT